VWASPVAIVDPGADAAAGFASRPESAEEDAFVFEVAPKRLNEDIIQPAAAPAHRDADAGILQRRGEGEAGELGALGALLFVKR
jgi:hypothetical protein